MSEQQLLTVEVAYALPDKQKIIALQVPSGTTALEAVRLSGIASEFPEIQVETAQLGVFGQALGTRGLAAADAYVLEDRDRVEIYRPLIADPKEARKRRAEKVKAEKAAAAKE